MYGCALRVQDAEPGGPWSQEHAAPPPERRSRKGNRTSRRWAETQDELALLLGPPLIAQDAAEAAYEAGRRLDAMDPPLRHRCVHLFVRALPLENDARARALARCLVRTGVSYLPVSLGLALLARLGEPQDAPYLKTLGLLRPLVRPVIHALDAVDRPAGALLALHSQEGPPELAALIPELTAHDEAAVREHLIALPGDVSSDVARRVAEATRTVELLSAVQEVPEVPDPQAAALVAQAGRLLFRMTSVRDYRSEILSYPHATRTYEALARCAGLLTPTLDHYGLLVTAVQELRTGSCMLHDWGPAGR
ncbi:hypothetical protein [Streptomyces sp. A0958]|uniref:hypothetical protein n=1 Tax=Streptomyces sp. A0958 TaxID=2563101 RepID=UPI001F0F2894|nr:hypothetical protein [Streptomyces sp. A0958]